MVIISLQASSSGLQENPDGQPAANRFTQVTLIDGLDEPMQIEFDGQGRIYWIERPGAVKRFDEATGTEQTLATLAVHPHPGLIGILLDQNFETTRQLYLYYAASEDEGSSMRLSRFNLGSDHIIDLSSEIVMLKVPWEQPDGTHIGGGMVWDDDGNLYLSIGDCTAPSEYAPIHVNEEDGRIQDAARTAGNTNDLRGAILRITPQAGGGYAIPEGNLFSEGTPSTRPEIYTMGNRNPWRLTIDSKTGYLHWGDVGPDAGIDSAGVGPKGHDEFNVARQAGNFGWPFVYGNRPYNRYDYETGTYGPPHNPEGPVNDSPNNTGLRELPPVQPALIAYPYGVSEEWPVLGSGARSAVGGPLFHLDDFASGAPRVFPSYYEDKWFVTDYVRNWIMVVTMNGERTRVRSVEPFLPPRQLSHSGPLDMDFGPSGDLYLVEYGPGASGAISKIEYNAGNRAPVARADSDIMAGAVPLGVQLSSLGTVDYDGDELRYEWTLTSLAGEEVGRFTQPHPEVVFEEAGKYDVELTVRDRHGQTGRDWFQIVAGNEPPRVSLDITSGNRTFYFPGDAIGYKAGVHDREDGSLTDGGISEDEVSVTAEYLPSGITAGQVAGLVDADPVQAGISLRDLRARERITRHNCSTCHTIDSPSAGPSFMDISEKYRGREQAAETLARSVKEGSYGVWGEAVMPPHPAVPEAEVREMTQYILGLSAGDEGLRRLSLHGSYITDGEPGQQGSHVLRASYTDDGSREREGLRLTGEEIIVLRYPFLDPETADIISERITYSPSTDEPNFIVNGREGHIGFRNLDLTGINEIRIGAITRFWHWSHFIGATVELRLDSPTGRLVGQSFERVPPPLSQGEGPFFGDDLDPPLPVNVSDVNGMQDVYIVVRNPEAGENDALLILTGLEFIK
ncbi:MAG: PQQ-dependent sugar dehydrogenase [Balneolales bacterium]